MQKKIAALVTIILMVVLILPATALADDPGDYQYKGVTYDGSEYSQLKAFLDTISASDTHDTNGKELSASYSDVDPTTWAGVTWTDETENGTTKHVTGINWTSNQANLNGDINLSDFTYLISFNLGSTQVDSLEVNNDTALTTLQCYQTHYDGTDGHPANTGITTLDVSKCMALQSLQVQQNSLTSLDVSNNTALTTLICSSNKLTSLDISKNTALVYVYCEGNQISGNLDCTNLKNLQRLHCGKSDSGGNALTALTVTGCASLWDITCQKNNISQLAGLGDCSALDGLRCDDNALTGLDVSGNQALTSLSCSGNKITTLNLSNNKLLSDLECSNCGLSSLNLTNNTALNSLDISKNNFSSIDLSAFSFNFLNCTGNQMTSVDAKIQYTEGSNFTVKLKASGDGYTGLYAYESDDKRELYAKAEPKTGAPFIKWTDASGKQVSTAEKYDLTSGNNYDLTANFETIKSYKVDAVSSNTAYGSVSGGGSFKEGDTVTLTAAPKTGYFFTGWYNGDKLVSSDATYKFTATQSMTLTARFGSFINVTAVSGNTAYGNVSGGGSFTPGASVMLTAVPNTGYFFAGWYDGARMVSASASYTFSASADVTLTAQFDKIGIPETITASSSAYNKITVKWSAVTGAKGYYVYRATSADGTYKKIATSKKTTYVNSGVTTGTTYYYKVAAYTKSYKGSFSAAASATAQLGQVTKVTATSSNPTKAVVKWKAVTGAKKYQVLRSDRKDGTYTVVKTTSAKTITDTGLIPGNTYYYKVAALKGSAFGAGSDIVSVTPKMTQATKVKASRAGASKVKLTWKAAAGATGYEVYVSTDGSSYSLLTDVKKASCYDLAAPKTAEGYYFKVVAYTTVNGTKYKGAESAAYHFTK